MLQIDPQKKEEVAEYFQKLENKIAKEQLTAIKFASKNEFFDSDQNQAV